MDSNKLFNAVIEGKFIVKGGFCRAVMALFINGSNQLIDRFDT